ncbi:MAG: hypothetical protein QXO84_03735 [Candidatus Aenigmatarchaeota archaeon]
MKLFYPFILTSLILLSIVAIKQLSLLVLALFFNLLALFILYREVKRDGIKKLERRLDSIDSVIKKLDRIRDGQNSHMMKAFEVEMNLEKYKEEQEERYREIVKKLLEIDNKFTEKYELLGKSVIKLSKEMKKD